MSMPSCASRCGSNCRGCCASRARRSLYVTQDYKEAMALGDRIAVLSQRQHSSRSARPNEIYREPANIERRAAVRRSDHQPARRRSRRGCGDGVDRRPGERQVPARPAPIDACGRPRLRHRPPARSAVASSRGRAPGAIPVDGRGRDAAQRDDRDCCCAPAAAAKSSPRGRPATPGRRPTARRISRFDPDGALLFDRASGERIVAGNAQWSSGMTAALALKASTRSTARVASGRSMRSRTLTLDDQAGRDRRAARLVGLRQDLDAAHDRRLRGGHAAARSARRPADPHAAAGAARRRDGLRGLFALSAADRAREHRLRAEGGAAADARGRRRRSPSIAELLEIDDILERYPSSISGGQQQRASLGRALVRKADLYLLDEPMGQLEPQLRAVLRGRIKHFICASAA